jgi:hypothetical protein
MKNKNKNDLQQTDYDIRSEKVSANTTIFRDVLLCSLVVTYCLHLRGRIYGSLAYSGIMKIEAVFSIEMSEISTRLHGVTPQTTILFIVIPMKASELTKALCIPLRLLLSVRNIYYHVKSIGTGPGGSTCTPRLVHNRISNDI